IKVRVWLPHRSAEEYLNNCLSVIDQQERSYDDTIKSINTLKSDLDNARQHPCMMQIEHELAHSMKFIEQENAADAKSRAVD
ncbi:MAG: PIN-like domain-containing protein, partial [Thermodesulfobacteriota bacterium]|nr:PIN-like domain-containing protein [Thermodesulfobacteriota bacterium]